MRDLNIAGVDLNLVPALEALLRQRNVTRAAADVGLSQPAMSRALARLRQLQDDPLLVRTPAGYALTPRAQALHPLVTAAVAQLRTVFQPPAFDPAEERRTVRLAATDAHTVLVVPHVMARLTSEAPGVDLRVESHGANLMERLHSGALDLAFALATTPLPPGVYSEVVAEDRLALVMRQGHPAASRAWRLSDYETYPHVGVSIMGDGQSGIDALLASKGLERRIALVTPHYMAALATVAATDLVSTLPAALAARFAPGFELMLRDPPFGGTTMQVTLVCSHVRAGDPFLAWFRNLIREVAGAPTAHPAAELA
jgi:DNA-binding transcriptional LysR family regulator